MRHSVISTTSVICLVSMIGAGCAETNIQAIRRLQPAYTIYRNDLAAAITTLPEPGTVHEWSMPKEVFPTPVFFEDRMNDPEATAEIIYLGEKEQAVSLSIRSPIHFCLHWTGPKNSLHPDVWDRRGGLGEECEAALKRPWVVVLRMVESRLPEILRAEAFLFYAPNWSIVGSFPLTVTGTKKSEIVGDERSREVISAFHEAFGCELMQNLNKIPKASFRFDYRRCDGTFKSIAMPASLLETQPYAPLPTYLQRAGDSNSL